MKRHSTPHRASLLATVVATALLGSALVHAQPPQVPPEQQPPNREPSQQPIPPPTDQHDPRWDDRNPPNRLDPDPDRTDSERRDTRDSDTRGNTANTRNADANARNQAQPDVQFINEALQSGRMEIASARLAQERASSDEVKAFARELERDHSQLNTRLESLQGGTGSGPGNAHAPGQPGTPGGMGEGRAANAQGSGMSGELQQLSRASGAEFDRAFLSMQVRHHQESIRKFEAAANRSGAQAGGNDSVASMAREALPVLKRHAERAQTLSRQVDSR